LVLGENCADCAADMVDMLGQCLSIGIEVRER